MNSGLLQGFRLGPWLVEPLKGQVTGIAGVRHLPPKAVEVLLCLAERPADLVTHDELLDKVWGEGNGTHEALIHAVSEIRHALDDHHDDPNFIQTLPKRGYRLLIEPITGDNGATIVAPQVRSSWWDRLLRHGVIQAAAAYLVVGWLLIQVADTTFEKIGLPAWSEQFVTFVVIGGFPLLLCIAWFFEFVGGRALPDRGQQSSGLFQGLERNYLAIFIAYGLAGAGGGIYQWTVGFDVPQPPVEAVADPDPVPVVENSIAVLRLATFDHDQMTKVFSDGLSEDILDGLVSIPGLKVSGRGDSWSLPPHASSDVVRRRLRVAHYIEGSVRFLDDKLRVVIQLVDSDTGFHLFSRSFEAALGSTGDMQREITKLVIANLKLAVDESTLSSTLVGADTESDDAYVLWMRGREVMYRPHTVENIEEAIGFYGQALAIDGDYPAAHAGLCDAYVALYGLRDDTASVELAEKACARARSVAPHLPIVLRSVGRLYWLTNRLPEASSSYEAALEINEQDADALRGLAGVRRRQQRFDEAIALMQRAIELQPGNWRTINTLGSMYFRMGAYADAAAQYRKVVYLDPQNFVTLGNLAATSLMRGDFAGAHEALQRAIDIEENPTFVANLAVADYYRGDYALAIESFRRSIELAPQNVASWIGLADALQASGDKNAARDAYARSLELAREQLGATGDELDYLMFMGWATAMTGDTEAAIAFVERAVALQPTFPYAHYYSALVHLRAGHEDAAVDAVRLALENGYPVAMMAAEPILKDMRQDDRFLALLEEFTN